jgi:hypothetical protein
MAQGLWISRIRGAHGPAEELQKAKPKQTALVRRNPGGTSESSNNNGPGGGHCRLHCVRACGLPAQLWLCYRSSARLRALARDGYFLGNPTAFYAWGEKKFRKTKATLMTYMVYGSSNTS